MLFLLYSLLCGVSLLSLSSSVIEADTSDCSCNNNSLAVRNTTTIQPYFSENSIFQQWDCNQIPYNIVNCDSNRSLSVLTCNCLTYNNKEDIIEAGKCISNIVGVNNIRLPFSKIDITENGVSNVTCEQFNRQGTLCGNCKDGYYPLAHSFDMTCVECPNGKSNWWKFVLVAFLPLTILYLCILLFQINIPASHLQGYYFYCHGIALPQLARAELIDVQSKPFIATILKILLTVHGIWNLDFFRSFNFDTCLGLDTLDTLALEMIVGVYPLLLMLLTFLLITLYDRNFRPLVIIWKPFHVIFNLFRRNWNIRTSLIDAFATFLILSNMKFLCVATDIFATVKVYQLNSTGNLTVSHRMFYDATIPLFGERHLPYAILGIVVFTIFMTLPTLLLILYPFRWFQKLLNLLPLRWYILHTFMDSFHGCYKDGTQPGTRDCRWFASTFFILRIVMLVIGLATLNVMFYFFASMALVIMAIFLINLQPFKRSQYDVSNTTFMLLLAMLYVLTTGLTEVAFTESIPLMCIAVLVVVLPPMYIAALTLHWMYSHRRFGLELFRRILCRKHAYEELS